MVPKCGAYTIRGIYSDFKYHDVGEDFYQVQFDGSIVKKWRTAPLWGVGHTAPYGHDGASLDLDSVIRRHGGEAARIAHQVHQAFHSEQSQVLASSIASFSTKPTSCPAT